MDFHFFSNVFKSDDPPSCLPRFKSKMIKKIESTIILEMEIRIFYLYIYPNVDSIGVNVPILGSIKEMKRICRAASSVSNMI